MSIHHGDDIAEAWRKSVFQAAVSILNENLADWGFLHLTSHNEVSFSLHIDDENERNPEWRESLPHLIVQHAFHAGVENETIAMLEGIISEIKSGLTAREK